MQLSHFSKLENVIERLIILADAGRQIISPELLPDKMHSPNNAAVSIKEQIPTQTEFIENKKPAMKVR